MLELFADMENAREEKGFVLGVGNEEFSGKCFLVVQLVMSDRQCESGKGQE